MNRTSMELTSRLPDVGTTIFTVMSQLAREHGALNLSQGFPDFDCAPKLKEYVSQAMVDGLNQYAPMQGLPSLRALLCEKIEQWHGHAYSPATETCVTAGATQAIFTAITALVHPGVEVIILEPAYDCYAPAFDLVGARVHRVALDLQEGDLDIDALREVYHPGIRCILINTPHNPSGLIFSEASMRVLESMVADTNTWILSDEVYEHMVFDGMEHQSVARFPGLAERSLLVSSFGKTYHNTGWKLGYCMGPEPLMKEFLKVHQFNVFCVNRPVQEGFARFLAEDESCWGLSDFYQAKRDRFCRGLEGTRFKFKPSAGTYFQVLDCSAYSTSSDVELARQWTASPGVASIPVSAFFKEADTESHLLRFCFAKDDETIDRGIEILRSIS